jgi:signal transduction histidine kinase
MFWTIAQFGTGRYNPAMARTLAIFDLVIAALIAVAILLVGQAIVSYEVFTGKSLPRRGLLRYWARLIVLATGYAVLVGAALTLPLRPVYSVLLSAMLMVAFYALIGWRAYAERERTIQSLRPFVASPQLYERLLSHDEKEPVEGQPGAAFRALCEGFLEAKCAYLIPTGAQAALVGPALVYPPIAGLGAPPLGELARRLERPDLLYTPVDPEIYGGARWAIPLRSPLGPGGALLVGGKRSGGLYTQEEIEIARSAGERLVDMLAAAALSRRLMGLQRDRMAQAQVLDGRARRTLHDEILPRLHAALLRFGSGGQLDESGRAEIVEALSEVHRAISELLRSMPGSSASELRRLGLLSALRKALESEFDGAFETVDWEVSPEAGATAKRLPELHAEVLYYAAREAVRNAARHGRGVEPRGRPLRLRLRADCGEYFRLVVQDDGVGAQALTVGREAGGQGLSLHATLMAVIGGSLAVESLPGEWTRVVLSLPVEAGGDNREK